MSKDQEQALAIKVVTRYLFEQFHMERVGFDALQEHLYALYESRHLSPEYLFMNEQDYHEIVRQVSRYLSHSLEQNPFGTGYISTVEEKDLTNGRQVEKIANYCTGGYFTLGILPTLASGDVVVFCPTERYGPGSLYMLSEV